MSELPPPPPARRLASGHWALCELELEVVRLEPRRWTLEACGPDGQALLDRAGLGGVFTSLAAARAAAGAALVSWGHPLV